MNGVNALAAVVRSGGFAAAARSLNVSQPGVSRAVARLEARVGVRLLERTTRSVSLTDEGRRFYETIGPALTALEDAASSLAEGKVTVRGRLRVNIDPYFSQLILGPQLSGFMKEYPELKVDLITRESLGDLVADGYDLGIRFCDPRPSSLVGRRLLDSRILTVASPSYLKKHGHPSHPQELTVNKQHRMIDFRDPETGRAFEWVFRKGRKEIKIETESQLLLTDVATMHAVCLAGYGIAQVLDLGVEAYLASGRLVSLFPDWQDERFPLYAFYPSRQYLPPKTRAFLEFLYSTVLASHLNTSGGRSETATRATSKSYRSKAQESDE
ncbi:LysR family transcriptional regulator [Acidicapsa acidisoli]|uniref:LysR family transcriptional regulator n=1 Tax=Acidicapsa acidisoli TaxID=1615681 RepID=UPI0021DFDBA4|nr:LysR family transcriptional regulator [Acidicapsa acidisoli]